MRTAVLTLGLFLSGCASHLYNQINLPEGKSIYVGMSGQEVTQRLGPPHSVGQGTWGCPHSAKFATIQPGMRTVEWAWEEPKETIVVWLDGGMVVSMGMIQK